MSTQNVGFAAMCGAIDHEETTAEKIMPIVIVGGIFALVGANLYLRATGKIKPEPVYYGPGYYPAYYPGYQTRPGVTFNF